MSSIEIPGHRLAPIARRTASNAKTVAAVTLFAWALFLVAGIAMIMGKDPRSTTERAMDGGSTVLGLGFWLLALGAVAQVYLRRGKRATEVAMLAAAQKGHSFAIEGKKVHTSDMAGVIQEQLTFKVSGASRTELLAVPQATAMPPRSSPH